ncbi:hypothetical protein O7626_17180 [Micromonospora sp. WMMD1102]|uniref:endonuclease/exonuclease/phosphatase family protein n=1 Tax=Micromonospora sp. WMMD1102 TaxID=3016105 RepID=UPI002414D320|nr:endonuclease/exonuclease/phosphatase family protein [Micromonospora sp. WMMD1102]MDG4787649.1 hypothetical protein [Micromonospora sp. WMMD1102]
MRSTRTSSACKNCQEIANQGLRHLAGATGMQCHVLGARQQGIAAVAPGGHDRLALGIMWRPGIEPVPGTLRRIDGGPMWHNLISVALELGGHQITVATYHAPPKAGRGTRRDEARLIAHWLTPASHGREIVLAGDWNSISARQLDGAYYDPDPNNTVTEADLIRWGDDPPEIVYPTDRQPDQILAESGYLDLAVQTRAPWSPTTGHHPHDRNGPRRIDRILHRLPDAEDALACSVIGHRVHNTPLAYEASDHFPVVATARLP